MILLFNLYSFLECPKYKNHTGFLMVELDCINLIGLGGPTGLGGAKLPGASGWVRWT